jgi:hypothetical protein
VLRWTTPAACVALLAACGSTATTQPTQQASCRSPAAVRATARLVADVAAIRRAAARTTTNTLKGNPAVNRATDAFLSDVETAPIGNLARNRMIDHAAAALVGACEQCFQALEAARPIVQIEHHGNSCTS